MGQNIDPLDDGAYQIALPDWILREKCSKCGCKLRRCDFIEVGLYAFGSQQGEMFVRFVCPYCRHSGTYVYGDKKFTLVELFKLTVKDLQKPARPQKAHPKPITEEEYRRFRARLEEIETIAELTEWVRQEMGGSAGPTGTKETPEGEAKEPKDGEG